MTGTAVVDPDAETSSTSSTETLPIVAHQGGLELLDAKWELNSGRTVKFRLVGTDDTPMILHPFAQFVRRRGNRVGTRFHTAITRIGDDDVFYQGELMLAGGGNPLGQGMWVRFWMDEEDASHPFAGCAGRQRNEPGDLFMAVFVELDSDDEPINQEKRARAEQANGAGKGGPLARWAAMRSHDNLFLQYLSEQVPLPDKKLRSAAWWDHGDHVARWIRWICGIESRADLDNNPKAGEVFHERIRRPYSEWRSTTED